MRPLKVVIADDHPFVPGGAAHPAAPGPARLLPLRSLEDDELTYEALRQAARRGRLEAHHGSDGIWRATRHAVNKYKKARYQRSR